MEKLINQLGQTMKVTPQRKHTQVKIGGKLYYAEGISSVFEGSEFNPVLLADGSIIPHYKYNGQPVK